MGNAVSFIPAPEKTLPHSHVSRALDAGATQRDSEKKKRKDHPILDPHQGGLNLLATSDSPVSIPPRERAWGGPCPHVRMSSGHLSCSVQ